MCCLLGMISSPKGKLMENEDPGTTPVQLTSRDKIQKAVSFRSGIPGACQNAAIKQWRTCMGRPDVQSSRANGAAARCSLANRSAGICFTAYHLIETPN